MNMAAYMQLSAVAFPSRVGAAGDAPMKQHRAVRAPCRAQRPGRRLALRASASGGYDADRSVATRRESLAVSAAAAALVLGMTSPVLAEVSVSRYFARQFDI